MIFGDKNIYAIEVYHQPLDNDSFYMSGKMCIHLFNKTFGDIDNEYCQIFMAYGTLLEKINKIDSLKYDFSLNKETFENVTNNFIKWYEEINNKEDKE